MKAEKTYKELLQFQAQIEGLQKLYTVDTDPLPVVQQNRLIKKVLTSAFEDYNEKIEDLRLKLCIRDEKLAKVLDAKGGYQFTEENEKAFRAGIKALNNETVEVHYNQALSYQELLKLIDPKNYPFLDWEDMKDTLEPFYHNDPVAE